jgi:hypothetical protein
MVCLYDACDQISDFCHQQLLRNMQRKISWTDERNVGRNDGRTDGTTDGRTERRTDGRKGGQTDRGKTVYPLSGSGGIIKIFVFKKRYLYTEYRYIMCMHFTRYMFNLNSDIFITTRTPCHITFVNIFLSEFVGVDSF